MDNQKTPNEAQSQGRLGAAPLLGILQPEDSKRVANAIISTLEDECDGLGDAIIRAVQRGIMECVGSHEMGKIVERAIVDGISMRDDA